MIRRCRTPMAAVAAVFSLAGIAQAGRTISYDLTIDPNNPPGSPVSQVFAYVHPAGSIGPDPSKPTPTDYTPFHPLAGSSGFTNNDPNTITERFGDGTLNTGDPIQVLQLQFDNNGFGGPNASLKFALDVNPAYSGPDPTLELVQGTTGVRLSQYTPPVVDPTTGTGSTSGTGSSNNGGGTATVPEPMSIALWSAAAGLAMLRARAFRRGRRGID